MVEQVINVLNTLNELKKPHTPFRKKSTVEERLQRASNYLLFASGIAFMCLVGFAIRVTFGPPLTGLSRLIAITFGVISQFLALLAIVVQLVPMILSSFLFRKQAYRLLISEFQRDSEYATKLTRHHRSALEQADQYLCAMIDRRRLFLGAIVGSPEKVALLSLVAMGWSLYKEAPLGYGNWITITVQYGVALLGGLAFGSVLVNSVLRRYAYQRDLLALALMQLKQCGNAR